MKFAVVLEDVVQVPASSDSPPRARINFLFHAGDGSHRLFVNDMTGKIYVIRDGHVLPQPFLDMAIARKGSFTSTDLFEQGLNTFAFHPDFARGSRPGSGKLYTFSTETPQSGIADFPTPDAAGGVDHHDVVPNGRSTRPTPIALIPLRAERSSELRILCTITSEVSSASIPMPSRANRNTGCSTSVSVTGATRFSGAARLTLGAPPRIY